MRWPTALLTLRINSRFDILFLTCGLARSTDSIIREKLTIYTVSKYNSKYEIEISLDELTFDTFVKNPIQNFISIQYVEKNPKE